MHHLAPDRRSNSSRKCSHGHMYYLLETFGRSTVDLHSHENVPTGTCTKWPVEIAHSAKWRRIVRQPSDAPPRARSTDPYARKCSHGHMYYLLDTFGGRNPTRWRLEIRLSIRTKMFPRTPLGTRLSGGWRRIVRQSSDAPPPRSTDKFLSIRTKMFPRAHVLLA